jgi:hypothetical protein
MKEHRGDVEEEDSRPFRGLAIWLGVIMAENEEMGEVEREGG